MRVSFALTILALASTAPAQVTIEDLPRIAAARTARQRPDQEKALEPFWEDLKLEYAGNRKYLDEQITNAANLGDSVVPLLLEKLTPADDSAGERSLAGNCSRILQRMDPASFTDALIELCTGQSHVARGHAIRLLGYTGSPRAAAVLANLAPHLRDRPQIDAIASLTRLRMRGVAPQLVMLLGTSNGKVRERVLDYLVTVAPSDVQTTVIEALSVETEGGLLPRYIAYLAKVAHGSETACQALLPLLSGDRLDPTDTRALVRALGKIAPSGHKETEAALRQLLKGETGPLGRAAALSLHSLGDRKGVILFADNIKQELRRRRNDANLLFQKGQLLFELENWTDAIADFEKAVRYGKSEKLAKVARLRMASCEANRKRWRNALRHLKDSKASFAEIVAESERDPALNEALQQESVLRWLNALKRDAEEAKAKARAPKANGK